ncbi:hypothetical protein CKO15_12360 [Halorhodospira abdelmalekii]|nr:hypothetical protein [Halorhodospira abdelmalekii]
MNALFDPSPSNLRLFFASSVSEVGLERFQPIPILCIQIRECPPRINGCSRRVADFGLRATLFKRLHTVCPGGEIEPFWLPHGCIDWGAIKVLTGFADVVVPPPREPETLVEDLPGASDVASIGDLDVYPEPTCAYQLFTGFGVVDVGRATRSDDRRSAFQLRPNFDQCLQKFLSSQRSFIFWRIVIQQEPSRPRWPVKVVASACDLAL